MSTGIPGTSRPVPGSRDELLARMDEDWRGFRSAAEALGARVVEQATPVGWTYKQMLASVAAWHDLTARRLDAFRRSGEHAYPSEAGTTDEVNARAAAAAAGRTSADVFADLDRSYTALRQAVAALTDEQVARDVRDTPWGPASWAVAVVAGNSYGHYDEHRDELMAGLRSAQGGRS